ncbi:MAG: hypothetical protein LC124_03145 [Ignavibacteriales bacterium]|nr:hypothetical protein [Ignavibacterium album]MCZ2267829.1 hypothetical protein [Ignavibacteriales bacterium]HOJ07786.1 hypothetical protein [Ignavibacteriaceae bacterium]
MENSLNRKEPWLAAILSLFIGGVGQIYCGKIGRGIIFLIIDLILWFTIIGALVWGIVAAVDAYNIAKDINYKIDIEKVNNDYDNHLEVKGSEQLQPTVEIKIDNFIDDLKKTYKLYALQIYSEDEYRSKKDVIINTLANKKLSCSSIDFLTSLVELKEQKILNVEDINKIKMLII